MLIPDVLRDLMTPLPTLRQLQFFLALVRRQSFSKAAEDCLVSQSTLSSAIKEMEHLLDQQLVDRSTRAFALTPAGEEVARRSAAIVAQAEDLANAARVRRPLEGSFNLGVIPTIAPFMLPAATLALRQTHPKLELYLREDLSARLGDRLSAGLIDAALLALPYDLPGAEMIEIGNDDFWFVCAQDHPFSERKSIATSDLNDCRLLLLEEGHCLRDHALEACQLASAAARDSFGGTSLFTLMQMVRAGLGVTLVPSMAVKTGIASMEGLQSIPFADPRPHRKIGLAWRRGSGRGDEAAELADVFKNAATS